MSLFKIEPRKEDEAEMSLMLPDGSEFINPTAFRHIKKQLQALQPHKSYHLLSKGSWSLYELIVYLAKHIGSCSLVFSTWAISEEAALTFSDLQQKKVFTSVSGIFDHTTESHKNGALTICQTFFSKIAFSHLHAKVAVLHNASWNISIVSTANMTKNPRYERTIIFTNPEVATADITWLNNLLTC